MSEGRAGDGRGPEPPRPGNGAEDPGSKRPATAGAPGPEPSGGPATPEADQLTAADDPQLEEPQPGHGPEPPGVPGARTAGTPPVVRTMGHRPPVEPVTVLLAVERVGADVAALSRALAAHPEEVAARLDVDGATAAIGVRIAALGSALDQLRLSLLAALDRAAEHADAPSWVPSLQAMFADIAPRLDEPSWLPRLQASLAERDEAPPWLPALEAALQAGAERDAAPPWLADLQLSLRNLAAGLEAPPWLPALVDALAERDEAPPWLPDVRARLTEIGGHLHSPRWIRDLHAALAALAPRLDAPPWLADLQLSLSDLAAGLQAPPWLASLQSTLGELQPLVADQQRALRDAVTQLAVLELSLAAAPGNQPVLDAIARLPGDDRLRELTTAVQSLTGDDRLRELTTAVQSVAGDRLELGERLGHVERAVSELADGVRAGAAIADVLDHLGLRLVAIEDAAGRVATSARTLVEKVSPVPDRLAAIASQVDRITPLARAGDQAGTLFDQLDEVSARLDEVITLLRPPPGDPGVEDGDDLDERLEAVVDVLAGVTRRQDRVTEVADAVLERIAEQERSVSSHLGWVGERLAEVATRLVPDDTVGDQDDDRLAGIAETLAAMARRQDELGAAVAELFERDRAPDWLAEQVRAVADRQEELAAAMTRLLDREPPDRSLAAQIALIAQRQEELSATLASSFDQGRGPMAAAAVFDRMEQRERSLAARLDRIDAQLRGGALAPAGGEASETGADGERQAAMSLAASVENIATITGQLAALVESSSERLDRRLSKIERALGETTRPPPSAPVRPSRAPSSSTDAALRLAELRAQRAEVQARLQEERLLAAEIWDDHP